MAVWRPDDPVTGATIGFAYYDEADGPWLAKDRREIDLRVNVYLLVFSFHFTITFNWKA